MDAMTAGLAILAEQLADSAWASPGLPAFDQASADALTAAHGLDGALRWVGRDGRWVYPAFQFSLGAVHPGVVAAGRAFAAVFLEYEQRAPLALLAAWLTMPQQVWNGESASTVLAQGRDAEVAALTRLWAAALAESLHGPGQQPDP